MVPMVPLLSQSGMFGFQESDMAEFQDFSSETQKNWTNWILLSVVDDFDAALDTMTIVRRASADHSWLLG